ncbi:MAG: hypothetical protein IH956_03905, partial [Chloroflexi bacterium]|nr:hypothetical protein [Chloroflexota bacterium]
MSEEKAGQPEKRVELRTERLVLRLFRLEDVHLVAEHLRDLSFRVVGPDDRRVALVIHVGAGDPVHLVHSRQAGEQVVPGLVAAPD